MIRVEYPFRGAADRPLEIVNICGDADGGFTA
jgi:hypothetical protein